LGLAISSAPVESTIKQVNHRLKGSEKFWLSGGAEAVVQVPEAIIRLRRATDPTDRTRPAMT
jgi:cob(I)alamin adenosyltransferase